MKTLAFALLGVSIAACGDLRTRVILDTQPYLVDFVREATARNVAINTTGLIVSITEDPDFEKAAQRPSVIGLCFRLEGGVRFVEVKRSAWDAGRDADRRSLLFHELGHCLLGREHVSGRPDIMNPNVLPGQYLTAHYIDLVDALFGGPATGGAQ